MNRQCKEFYQSIREQILSFCEQKKGKSFGRSPRIRKEIMLDDQIDIKDIFFGLYDRNFIGVFQKINEDEIGNSMNQKGVAYIGMDSAHVGLWLQRRESHWLEEGESICTNKGVLSATCTMRAVVSFSYIHFCFCSNQQADFEEVTTPRQILALLPYVYDYFEKEKPKEERKQKVFYKVIK